MAATPAAPAASPGPGTPSTATAAAAAAQQQQAAAGQQATAGPQPTQPFVILLDVKASAPPNIRLPRSSGARGARRRACGPEGRTRTRPLQARLAPTHLHAMPELGSPAGSLDAIRASLGELDIDHSTALFKPCARVLAGSLDAIEADLGELRLRTAAIQAQRNGPRDANGWPLLVEACDLGFSGEAGRGHGLHTRPTSLGCGWRPATWACLHRYRQLVVALRRRQAPVLWTPARTPARSCHLNLRPHKRTPAPLPHAGVGCTVVRDGVRGANVIHNAESGWRLHWRRPLQPELRGERPMVRAGPLGLLARARLPPAGTPAGSLHAPASRRASCHAPLCTCCLDRLPPQFDLSLSVPSLKATLSDREYQLMTSVAADNFAEVPVLPAGARCGRRLHGGERGLQPPAGTRVALLALRGGRACCCRRSLRARRSHACYASLLPATAG